MTNSEHKKIKEPTTFQKQIEILEERKLIIEDKLAAKDILSRVNYYRLSAYMLSFQTNDCFLEGVKFKDIFDLYEFDRKLRNLCWGLLEVIEIEFRTRIAYTIAHRYGKTGHLCACNFASKKLHDGFIKYLNQQISRRGREPFVKHHKRDYKGVLPVWVAVELLSFGCLSKMFMNLKKMDKEQIAKKYYKIPYKYIESWLHALSTFRNICAHYVRVYNRTFSIKPKMPERDKGKGIANDTAFAIFFIMRKITKDTDWRYFITNLEALVERYDHVVNTNLLGFPENWQKLLQPK